MALATLLLPVRARFGGQRLSAESAAVLGRADHREAATSIRGSTDAGRAQLRRHFTLVPDHWPMAALTRRVDADDAATACWLRADPAHVRAGINGATLFSVGDMLALTDDESQALLRPLRPLFGDTGFTIDAPVPGHWYLRLPREGSPPEFVEPDEALGNDVSDQVPEGASGRRWRTLLSEAQVSLHNHPVNAARAAAGKPPVNSLWFWGGGRLPDHVSTPHSVVQSPDEVVLALADAAAVACSQSPAYTRPDADLLADLRHLRDLAGIERDWLQPALGDVHDGKLQRLQLDFADGHLIDVMRSQRWRFWRKPLRQLAG